MELQKYLQTEMSNENIPILFIGSGITKRYCTTENFSPPKWEELLTQIISTYNANKYHFELLKDEAQKEMIEEEREIPALYFEKIAKKIEVEFKTSILKDSLFDKQLQNKILEIYDTDKTVTPMKIYISILLSDINITQDKKLLAELEEFKKLSNKPLIIITTNYDDFLEKEIFKDYRVYKGQELLTDNSFASVFKIHGCVSKAKTIVITDEDYEKMEKIQKVLNARLITFFAEHPVFFLGYSLDDINIQNFINNIFESFSENLEVIEKISKKFVLVEWKKDVEEVVVEDFTVMKSKVIPIKKIKTDNFLKIYKSFNDFNINIDVKQFRFMQDLFLVALQGDKEKQLDIVFAQEYTGGKLPKKVLVGAGYATSFLAYDSNTHYLRIVSSSKQDLPISPEDFFVKFLPILKKGNGGHIPCFCFLKDFDLNKELPEKNIHFVTKALEKVSTFFNDYREISTSNTFQNLEEIESSNSCGSRKEKFIAQLYVNGKISDSEIQNYIKKETNLNPKDLTTFLRRLITIYDYKVNRNEELKRKIKIKFNIDLP